MGPRVARVAARLSVLTLFFISANYARGQASGTTLAGAVTAGTGSAIPNANIALTNSETGTAAQAQTDTNGHYSIPNVQAGEYELTVTAEGFATSTTKVTIAPGADAASQTADVTLNAPLSLGDLGFSSSQTQGSAADQARLNKRTHMLKVHQTLGLIDVAPMVATVATSFGAGGRSTSTSDRWAHMALGSTTADLYFTSAYFAIFAPKIPGTQTRGGIKLHKTLAWIHGPGMIITPILGAIAFDQKSKGERVHGIASAHGPVAIVTAAAYGAAILSLTFKW
jgi:hypothetical protein